MSTDCIVKTVLLRASRQRVWRALTDPAEFGGWFGLRFDATFVAGTSMTGVIVPTLVDEEVARMQKPYEGLKFEIVIEKIEPERLFSFRWHPGAVEPGYDYSAEPMTLVEFLLAEQGDGILLTVTESGFDAILPARRAKAFAGNEAGWDLQVNRLIVKHLARNP
jgi:uncharacterized protein YndB with AHSA1/START domain